MKQLQEIMSAIGPKRFITLVVIGVICAALGGAWQKVLLPQHEKLKGELSQVQSERSRLQTEIAELPGKHAALEASEHRYDVLRQKGFFVTQDRIEARVRMSGLRSESRLNGLTYRIEPQEKKDNPNFTSETEQVVVSGIETEMRSLTDLEALEFVERMQNEFSGLVVLKSLSMERKEEPTTENLKELSQGRAVDFITGKASFEWYSIVPVSTSTSTPLSQAFEGTAQ